MTPLLQQSHRLLQKDHSSTASFTQPAATHAAFTSRPTGLAACPVCTCRRLLRSRHSPGSSISSAIAGSSTAMARRGHTTPALAALASAHAAAACTAGPGGVGRGTAVPRHLHLPSASRAAFQYRGRCSPRGNPLTLTLTNNTLGLTSRM